MAKKEITKETASTVAAKAAAKVATGVLKKNPEMNEVFVTSDGTAFYTRNDAQNHAKSLQNREVFNIKRGTASVVADKAAEKTPTAPATDGETDELTGETTDNEPSNADE